MVIFEDIQDVEAWVEPMGYIELWEAAAPFGIFGDADREHCDALIAKGKVGQDLILSCLKEMVRLDLTAKLGLKRRIYEPVAAQYLKSTH